MTLCDGGLDASGIVDLCIGGLNASGIVKVSSLVRHATAPLSVYTILIYMMIYMMIHCSDGTWQRQPITLARVTDGSCS